MIYTSYYANHRNFLSGFRPVCISLWPPRGFRGDRKLELAPTKDLLMDYKDGKADTNEYILRFNQQLERLDVKKIAIDVEGCILLCYEKTGDFCHRHLVGDWLKAAGYSVEELPNKKIIG
jgi:hypothetical protein